MEAQQSQQNREVGVLNPNKKETTSKVKTIVMTMKPYPEAWLRKETVRKLVLTTPIIIPDQSLVQDEYTSVVMARILEEDDKFITNGSSLCNRHGIDSSLMTRLFIIPRYTKWDSQSPIVPRYPSDTIKHYYSLEKLVGS